MSHNPNNNKCQCNNTTTIGGYTQKVCKPTGCEFCTCPPSAVDRVEEIRARFQRMGEWKIMVPNEYRLGRPEANLPADFSDDDVKVLLSELDAARAENERLKHHPSCARHWHDKGKYINVPECTCDRENDK